MNVSIVDSARIRAAWQGRVSGCLLGKPLEVLSFQEGRSGLQSYLKQVNALPLRDYVPLIKGTAVEQTGTACCRENIVRAEADDDINYTVLALLLLEKHGLDLDTADVARAWLCHLPGGTTWTAEREAYRTLMNKMDREFGNGAEAGFDIAECSDNEYNDWIGAQIRADLYGSVCPGRPALGAAIPMDEDLDAAFDEALKHIPADSKAAAAVRFGRQLQPGSASVDRLHDHFADMSPVHTLNNLALVVWALNTANGDFSAAIGNAVASGWDTDCNEATVGDLIGLTGAETPDSWTQPWAGRVGVDLAGQSELSLDDLVDRTVAVANRIASQVDASK